MDFEYNLRPGSNDCRFIMKNKEIEKEMHEKLFVSQRAFFSCALYIGKLVIVCNLHFLNVLFAIDNYFKKFMKLIMIMREKERNKYRFECSLSRINFQYYLIRAIVFHCSGIIFILFPLSFVLIFTIAAALKMYSIIGQVQCGWTGNISMIRFMHAE